ncbi:FAD-linked oxidoreductase-like protein 18 [Stagonosporopsis vannaccii]|nr:FAD-linked oxidoreductase-like protein 18 [Stagonosporopsis vannaccii]
MKIKKGILLQVLNITVLASASELQCKCTPKDAYWPSTSDWAQLNTTLSGSLIRAVPPAAVCYADEPNYNEEACSRIRERWFDSTFHGSDPISVDYPIWTNNSCNPIYLNGTSITGDPNAGRRGCGAATYPAFVVNATSAEQVAIALKWAVERDIRVVVKATGHSYTGRSIGGSSLSIWTHNFRGLEYIQDFSPTSCPDLDTFSAVRVAAGHTNGEVQSYLNHHSRIIVSGANPSVGIVGWLTGGGHGFLSSTYGMGSDNLLEATVVLPNGSIVTVNPWHHTDVFFAIRGGGGGTFGVITEVVLRTFPSPQTSMHVFRLASLPETTDEQFYEAVGYLHTQMPGLKKGGMAGYYYIVGPPAAPTLSLMWAFMLFDRPDGAAEALMARIESYLAAHADLFAFSSNLTSGPSYFSLAAYIPNEPVANGGSTYGSRLLSPSSLSNLSLTARTLHLVGPSGHPSRPNGISNPTLIGHMIGPLPSAPSYSPHTSSLNPAWRDTLTHLVVVEGWQDGAPQSLIENVYKEVSAKTQLLRGLSPITGAYFNEADSRETGWQESFFGAGYERLVGVKREVDPRGVLWCRLCVGSEVWEEHEGERLCQTGRRDRKH